MSQVTLDDVWHALNRVRCGSVSEKRLDEWAGAVWRDVVAPLIDENAAELGRQKAEFGYQFEQRQKLIAEQVELVTQRDEARALAVELERRVENLQQDWSDSAMAGALAHGYYAIADFMAQRDAAMERVAELEHQLQIRDDVIDAKDSLIDGLSAQPMDGRREP